MHFEILVEDQSGKKALEAIVPKIIGDAHTYNIRPFMGIGRIPKNMKTPKDARKRTLLDNLPRFLRGFGKTFSGYPSSYRAAVIVVCDLDTRCRKEFRGELLGLLDQCNPCPETRFCIAVEEGEAWLLGDLNAIVKAFPKAKKNVLDSYVNDSICGTWERLADALYPGGVQVLISRGWQAVGAEKSRWAKEIAPFMDVMNNASPSFRYFRDKLQALAQMN